jgi:hypothetical protein
MGIAVMLLTACGGLGGVTPPPEDAGGGVLRVEVDGVPGNVGANVLVTGPDGFSERVSAGLSVFSDLPLGAYEIVAFGVTDDTQSDSGYTPIESSFVVEVGDVTGASVLVEYEEMRAVASDRSRPMDAATASLLVDAESSSLRRFSAGEPLEETGGTLRFATSNAYLDGLEVGDVITVGVTPVTPQGFLGTVLEVRGESDGSVVVEAGPATLQDAVEQGVLAFSTMLSPADVVATATYYDGIDPLGTPDGLQSNDISHSFCPIANQVDLLQDSQHVLELDGSVCFTLDVDFSTSVRMFRSNELSFVTTVRETAEIELTGEANLPAFDRTFPLVDYTLTPITIWAGPVPVVVTPVITVSVTAAGSLEASFHTGVEQSLTFSAGLNYRDGKWEQVRPQLQPDFTHTPLTFDAGLQVSAGVQPQLALNLYGVVGPTLAMTVSAQADVTLPAWRLLFGLDVQAGVQFDVLGYFELSYEAVLFAREWQVAQGEGGLRAPPAIDSFLASPRSIESGESTTLSWTLSGGAPDSVSISPGVGSVAGRSSITVDPTAATTYTLSVANDAGVVTSSTTVSVSDPSDPPAWSVSPTALAFETPAGGAPISPKTLVVTNAGDAAGTVQVTVDYGTSGGSWLSVSPSTLSLAAGSSGTVTASATGCTGASNSTAAIVFNGGGAVERVPVQLACYEAPASDVTVSINPTSASMTVGESRSFSASVSGAQDSGVTWSRTCGSISGTGTTVTYVAPNTAGTCVVTARSVADATKSAAATVTVASAPPAENRDPEIHTFYADPDQPTVGQTLRLRWSVSDPDGDAVRCTVDFGDGTTRDVSDCVGTTSATHAYSEAGNQTAILVVVDSRGASDFAFASVSVDVPPSTNRRPVIDSFTVSLSSSTAPATATFRWDVSDPDGDVVSCLVGFGDGQESPFITNCESTTSVAHTFSSPGNYTAVIAITDPDGLQTAESVNFSLAAASSAPVITSISPTTPSAIWSGQNVRINGTGFERGAGVVLFKVSSGTPYDVSDKAQFVSSSRIDLTNIVFGTPAGLWRVMVRNDPTGAREESNWYQFSTQ